nr:hypothetical protein [uncultured Rhodopila sp.]
MTSDNGSPFPTADLGTSPSARCPARMRSIASGAGSAAASRPNTSAMDFVGR